MPPLPSFYVSVREIQALGFLHGKRTWDIPLLARVCFYGLLANVIHFGNFFARFGMDLRIFVMERRNYMIWILEAKILAILDGRRQ